MLVLGADDPAALAAAAAAAVAGASSLLGLLGLLGAGERHEQVVDLLLGPRVQALGLADVDHPGAGVHQCEDLGGDEPVVEHDVGLVAHVAQCLLAAACPGAAPALPTCQQAI